MTSTLHALTAALTAVGEAVTRDDRDGYITATQKLRSAGGTREQIIDAHTWRNHLRRRSGLPLASFGPEGEQRSC